MLPIGLHHHSLMRTPTLIAGLALFGLVLGGCGKSDDDAPTGGGSGGKAGAGGSGGNHAPSGSGGSTGTGGASTSGGSGGGVGGAGGSAGGGAGGSVGGTGGRSDAGSTTDVGQSVGGDTAPPASAGNAPYGCAGCKKIFDGTTMAGWDTAPGSWEVKDGALSSTGKNGDIYTKEDYGDYRVFFQVRQIKGDHKPCTTLFGKRPADPMAVGRGLGGAQFQPPNGASWNYGVGGTFTRHANPNFNVNNWHQCEILVKEAGSFTAACCPVAEGGAACKGVPVLSWKGPGRKHPFNIMIHNPGLFDQYREIWLEVSPKEDALLSTK